MKREKLRAKKAFQLKLKKFNEKKEMLNQLADAPGTKKMLISQMANMDDAQQEIELEDNGNVSEESMSECENMSNVKSSASCWVSNITGFTIGA